MILVSPRSYSIKGKTILFDAGTTAEIFQRNLKSKEKYSSRAVHTAR